jgi:Spy/CpxP family protein refolding chaperone
MKALTQIGGFMKFSNKCAATAAAVLIAGFLGTAYAQPHPGFRGPRAGMMGEGAGMTLPLLLRGANLTADQKTQVQQIVGNHRATFQSLFSQLRAAQDQISSKLLSTGAVSESDLAPQLQQISTLRSQLAEEGLRVALEIRSILTPDQLAKAAQFKTQMQSLRSQMKSLMAPPAAEQ